MALSLGDTAPDFMAHTTEGPIRFHDWIGDSWCVLFSHPKDWKHGDDVIIAGSISDDQSRVLYPRGWQAPKPYIRIVPQPR